MVLWGFGWLRFWRPFSTSDFEGGSEADRRKDIVNRLEHAKFSEYSWVVVVAGVGFFTDAYSIFAINMVLQMLGIIYYDGGILPHSYETALSVVTLGGSIIGQIAFGLGADIWGRRKMYGLELIITIGATLGVVMSSTGQNGSMSLIAWLLIWRFVLGIGIGADYPLSAVICSEFAPTRHRGKMLTLVFACQPLGQVAASLVTLAVTAARSHRLPEDATAANCNAECIKTLDLVWRLIIGAGIIPAVIALWFRLTIIESPRYTADVGRDSRKAVSDVKQYMAVQTIRNMAATSSFQPRNMNQNYQSRPSSHRSSIMAHNAGYAPTNMEPVEPEPWESRDPSPHNQSGYGNQAIQNANGTVRDSMNMNLGPEAWDNRDHSPYDRSGYENQAMLNANGAARKVMTSSPVVMEIHPSENGSPIATGRRIIEGIEDLPQDIANEPEIPPPPSWKDFKKYMWHDGNLRTLIATSFCWFCLDLPFYGLGMNSPRIISVIWYGNASPPELIYPLLVHNVWQSLVVVSTGALVGIAITYFTIDTLGRRVIQLNGFFWLFILFVVIGASFHHRIEIGGNAAIIVLYILCQIFFNFGPNATTYIMPAELFPTRYRALSHGIAAAAGKLGSVLAQLFLAYISYGPGINYSRISRWLPYSLLIFSMFMLLGLLSTLYLPAHEHGANGGTKTLEEWQVGRATPNGVAKTRVALLVQGWWGKVARVWERGYVALDRLAGGDEGERREQKREVAVAREAWEREQREQEMQEMQAPHSSYDEDERAGGSNFGGQMVDEGDRRGSDDGRTGRRRV